MQTFKIVKEMEKVMPGTTTATITGLFEYSGKINSIKVRVGTNEQLFGSDVFVAEVNGKAYSANITGLRSGTLYHYRYEVDYGAKEDFLTEISSFSTQSESPTVKTLEWQVIDSTTFRIKCKVEADGGQEVTERGICWNTYTFGDPTMDDETKPYGSGGLGNYSITMTALASNTVYHVRAYARNASGIGFGEELEFRTGGEVTKPQVSTVEITNVTYNVAQCLGNISSDGGLSITERGVCWGLEPDPTINVHHAVAEGTEIGNFTVTINGLLPNTAYHVRCYATNEKGISYGEELTFTTTDGKSTVTTAAITNVTATSAWGGGEVTDEGASDVTERGICWSTNHNPTINDSHEGNGTGAGSYMVQMTDLTPNQTYYVRAYATNAQGTSYGAEVDFTATEGLPVVKTLDVTDITATTAKGHGKVTDQGGSTVTERGICWSTESSPTIDGSHAQSGTGSGEYEVSLTNLTPGTKYYVRAYAKNTQGLTYGEEKDFTTEATLPTLTIDGIEGTTVHYTVIATGGATVTEHGICWGTSHSPSTTGSHASGGTGIGSFEVELTDLAPGTTYYIRAYASNNVGTAYSSELNLTTQANLPTVITGEVSNITQTIAQGSGNVTNDGGATVTERGVCWSTSHNPTIGNSHAQAAQGGTGSFTVNMSGLTANTQYYVRAYAKNSAGIAYGDEVGFKTSQNISAPTVTTAPVTNITQTTATGGGNVSNDGGAPVTERGICWSTNHNPTTNGSHASSGTGTGAFTVNMTGLTAGTTYYVRAYAINSQGTSYGSEVSFTTQQPTSYTISVSASPSNGGSAHVGSTAGPTSGTYNSGQSCTVYATANSGYTFTNWTENGNVVSTNASYTFQVNSNRTLVANFITKPTVTTNDVTNIQQTTATGGGNVTNSGGATVTERGICWGTNHNPTTSGSHAAANSGGTGTFTVNMTGLTPSTTYYVRSYAINSVGTNYGGEKSFSTNAQTYTINVSANPTNGGTAHVGSTTGPTTGTFNSGQSCTIYAIANSGYTFTNWTEGSNVVSTQANYTFTVNSNRTLVANFTQQHTISVSANPTYGGSVTGGGQFQQGQSCTVTAATNSGYAFASWTENGNVVSKNASYTFTVTGNRTLIANFLQKPTGAICGLFSVSSTQQVWFSQGNLKYRASTNTWCFANNQYDYIGDANSNISQTYNDWIDLFGWGTSGWDSGNTYYHPWDSDNSNGSLYGPYGNYNLTGTYSHADWGVHNSISNTNCQWRTLTGGNNSEWNYIFNTRNASTVNGVPNARFVKAIVYGVPGVVLFPDNYMHPSSVAQPLGINETGNMGWDENNYSADDFALMQSVGAVFLPAAGSRNGTSVVMAGGVGNYWSASFINSNQADGIFFGYNVIYTVTFNSRYYGFSVRLVCPAQ